MARSWRLIVDPAGSGPWNMAVDEALLASVVGGGPPTLRFYTWQGAWLSLGRSQALGPARPAACAEAGVGVVRRITGGRAVLHGADLTYAVAAPAGGLPPGLAASYQLLTDALVVGLRRLSLEVESGPAAGRKVAPDFDCFAEPAAHEICAGGRKLVGSAQRRARGALLQHGSIRLRPDPPGVACATGLDPSRATSLVELGWRGEIGALVETLCGSLAEALGASLERAGLAGGKR